MCNGNFNRGFNDGNFFNKGCNCCSCNNNYDDALFREVERIACLLYTSSLGRISCVPLGT